MAEAVEEAVRAIIQAVRAVLERTPPELAADIVDKGIILTGGGSILQGLTNRIAAETDIPVELAEDPVSAVAIGTGRVLEDLERMRHVHVLVSRV